VVGRTGVDVRFTGLLRFPGGVAAEFHCGFDLPDESRLEAIGSEGSVLLLDPWHARRPGFELRRGDRIEWVDVEHANSYRLELENMCDAIRGKAELLLGRDDAVAQARAIEALYRSASSARAENP
jgi:predicted dehydrogenase